MRQANLDFFPEQILALALALVVLHRIGLHDGHHSTFRWPDQEEAKVRTRK
jgi:hypothetical protein